MGDLLTKFKTWIGGFSSIVAFGIGCGVGFVVKAVLF